MIELNFLTSPDPDKFFDNAKELMQDYGIFKEDSRHKGEEIFYKFLEVEFYYFNSEIYNEDKSAYPRDTEAGEWFFHLSGVDLTFKTEKSGKELKQYGGILVRGVEKYINNVRKEVIGGPLRCLNEIFSHTKKFPIIRRLPQNLISKNLTICQSERFGLDKNDKVGCNKPYRFFVQGIDWKCNVLKYCKVPNINNGYSVEEKYENVYYPNKPKDPHGNK